MSRDSIGSSRGSCGSRLLVLPLALAALPARAQEPAAPELPEPVQRELQAAQDSLARAIAEFDGPQQSRSIVAFDDVIRRLEAIGPRALPARGRDALAQAYEYRGRAYYGIGLSEKASENFRLLVQLKPDHTLSKERASPKIVELFASVKRALVGYLTVSSRPAGARVTLVGAGGARTTWGSPTSSRSRCSRATTRSRSRAPATRRRRGR